MEDDEYGQSIKGNITNESIPVTINIDHFWITLYLLVVDELFPLQLDQYMCHILLAIGNYFTKQGPHLNFNQKSLHDIYMEISYWPHQHVPISQNQCMGSIKSLGDEYFFAMYNGHHMDYS